MIESKLFEIVPVYRFLFAISLLTVAGLYWVLEPLKQSDKFQQDQIQREFQCTPISQSVNELDPFHQERFWYDLVVNQNISSLNQLPIHILQSHGCFWLTQIQIFREENDERKVKCLSEVMQSQMEKVLEDVDCSNRLTLNCGHQLDCVFGIQARRTDKVTEDKNSYHSNDEYKHIFEAYFKMLGNPQDPKTAFVASDDRSVLADFRNTYKLPRYTFPWKMQLRNLWVVIQHMPTDS
ncbi:unnamed protein product [Allacma fusca]|uniref:Alpha-(1,6)-fucosyltransferase N- and catalytic domain-containing protein n=1 Tax=Allacma fusca TaxID=39272 RepID=A0A8J2LPA7_9HEXA|nr:unnamed protein product [Allacma fusca]